MPSSPSFRRLRRAAFPLLLALAPLAHAAVPTPAPAAEAATVETFLRATNFDLLPRSIALMGDELDSQQGGALPPNAGDLFRAHFPAEAVAEELRRAVANLLSEEDARAVIAFARSPLGARAAEAERAQVMLPYEAQHEAELAAAASLAADPARRAAVARLVAELHAVELTLSISRAMTRAMMDGMAASGAFGDVAPDPATLDLLAEKLAEEARPEAEARAQASMEASWGGLSMEDLEALGAFWREGPGETALGICFGAARGILLRRSAALGAAFAEAAARKDL